jgi:putative FmdB family regulatory protein
MKYDYKCIACGHAAEEVHPMADASLTQCPVCLIEGVYRKVIYATPTLFKGEGWETNDKSGRYHPKGGS